MFSSKRKHPITIIFIFFLILVFVLLASILISFGSGIYSETVNSLDNNFDARTCQAYFANKIRQNDSKDMIFVDTEFNQDVLKIFTDVNDSRYVTYLYEYNGYLNEYFTRSDLDFELSNGTPIVEMTDLSFSLDKNLLVIFFNDSNHISHTLYLNLHS